MRASTRQALKISCDGREGGREGTGCKGGGGWGSALSSPCTAVVQKWRASSLQSTRTTFPHRVRSTDEAAIK